MAIQKDKGGERMSLRKQTFRVAPAKKRLIRKRIAPLQDAITNVTGTQVLDTIEEEETLVRTIGTITVQGVAAGFDALLIGLAPAGVDVVDVNDIIVGNAIEGRDAKFTLWSDSQMVTNASFEVLNFDVKGQRKLSEGDVLKLYHRGSAANLADIAGVVTLFYKKA